MVDNGFGRIDAHASGAHQMPAAVTHQRSYRHVDGARGAHGLCGAFEVKIDQSLGVLGVFVDELGRGDAVAVGQGVVQHDAIGLIWQVLRDDSPFE